LGLGNGISFSGGVIFFKRKEGRFILVTLKSAFFDLAWQIKAKSVHCVARGLMLL
jgi:hypothetical protein